MSTVVETLQNGVRTWLRAMCTLTADQVISGSETGPRPPLPYLTVTITAHDLRRGEDERVEDTARVVTVTGGEAEDVLLVTLHGPAGEYTDVSYERVDGDTDATAAAALAALLAVDPHVVAATVDPDDGEVILIALAPTTESVEVGDDLELDAEPAQTIRTRGQRYATVSIQGFDARASDGSAQPSVTAGWLQRCEERLGLPASAAALEPLGFDLDLRSGTTFVPEIVDTAFESRYLMELEATYALDGDRERVDEVAEIVVAMTDDDGAGYSDADTIDIETGA